MHLTIDFETRSEANIKEVGTYRYAEDPTTEILCLAVKVDDNRPQVWVPAPWRHLQPAYVEPFLTNDQLQELINRADIIEAHNVEFELQIWLEKMTAFDPLPKKKLRCTAARAAAVALPRYLEGACEALHLRIQKDKAGHLLMQKMCKPRKPTKKNKAKWWEANEDMIRLIEYCCTDVDAERELSKAIPELSQKEYLAWRHTMKVNERGLLISLDEIEGIEKAVRLYEETLAGRVPELTDGAVESTTQTIKIVQWLNSIGVKTKSVARAKLRKLLAGNLPAEARELLEIRQTLGRSSLAKYETMKRWACKDGRIRGLLMYHGAGTGRFTGKGPQPHNYPRGTLKGWEDYCIRDFQTCSLGTLEALWGDPMEAAASCLRGVMVAPDGRILVAADLGQIEARKLAWLADETRTLQAFREGLDAYRVAAQLIYRITYDEVTDDQRQVGKAAVLACGYQGGWKAYQTSADIYNVKVPEEEAQRIGQEIYAKEREWPGEEKIFQWWATPIVTKWRKANPNIVRFWAGVENAALKAVETGKPHAYGPIKYGIRKNWLCCRLPSGRLISYYAPEVQTIVTPWGAEKAAVTYLAMKEGRWVRDKTYGGKLTENIVQASSRDILTEAMIRLERERFPVVMHVHDEVIVELPKSIQYGMDYGVARVCQLLCDVPSWAEGLPITADGWAGRRYRK